MQKRLPELMLVAALLVLLPGVGTLAAQERHGLDQTGTIAPSQPDASSPAPRLDSILTGSLATPHAPVVQPGRAVAADSSDGSPQLLTSAGGAPLTVAPIVPVAPDAIRAEPLPQLPPLPGALPPLPPVPAGQPAVPVVVAQPLPPMPALPPQLGAPPPPPAIAQPPAIVAAPVAVPADEVSPALKTAILATLEAKQTPHLRLTKPMRAALVAFYAERDNRPLWLDGKGWTKAGEGVIRRLRRAEEDGLDGESYALPKPGPATPEGLAQADVALTIASWLYARDARGGRLDTGRLSAMIDVKLELPAIGEVMAALTAASDANAALHDFNPRHDGYRKLRSKLAELQGRAPLPSDVVVPPGGVLRVGMKDERVLAVRKRLQAAPLESDVYDEELARAVAAFQRVRGLPANGVLTNATVLAFSADTGARATADIVANMERWRWLPRDLGERYILVNLPEYLVRVVESGVVTHSTRAIIGKPDTPTPLFSDQMEFLVVNPSWYVPPSILKKEFLPKLATDPTYAERRGYEVIRRGSQISVRQPPGERNALGNIKFMFPNRHAVYMHDTPSRSLFGTTRRAYSHGCVRVDQPFKLAEIVLSGDDGWSEGRIRKLVGAGERTIKLAKSLPVHLVYFTHWVDETGQLASHEDLYGYQRRVREALGYDTRTRHAAVRRTGEGARAE